MGDLIMNKLLFALMTLMASFSFAHKYHTEDVCTPGTEVCAHLGYNEKPEAGKIFEFMTHFSNEEKMKDVSDVKIRLGVESAEGEHYFLQADVEQLDAVHFRAKAQDTFSLALWFVLVEFKYQGQDEFLMVFLEE